MWKQHESFISDLTSILTLEGYTSSDPQPKSAKIPTHNGPQPQPTLSMSRFFRFRLKVCQWALPNVRTEKKKKTQIMRMFFPSICWEFVCLQWLQLTQLTNGYGNVPSFGNSGTHVEFIGILRRASPPRRVKKFTRQVWVKKLTIRIFLWPFGWWWANWWKIFPIFRVFGSQAVKLRTFW